MVRSRSEFELFSEDFALQLDVIGTGVIWMDIDYMDRFRCFTFDAEKFPSPARLNADLHAN